MESTMKRHNIEFLWGWFDALRRRDTDSMGAALDPGVVWQGIRPDLVCHGADEVITAFLTACDANQEIDSLELLGGDRQIVLGARARGLAIDDVDTGGDTIVLVAGRGPDGLAVLRFREAIWMEALECHLADLYVVPERRGQGIGRALMEASMNVAREQGAAYMDLGTSEDDVAARALYESLGFSSREGRPDGPVNYYYEREL